VKANRGTPPWHLVAGEAPDKAATDGYTPTLSVSVFHLKRVIYTGLDFRVFKVQYASNYLHLSVSHSTRATPGSLNPTNHPDLFTHSF
jgi:hypothetical protein